MQWRLSLIFDRLNGNVRYAAQWKERERVKKLHEKCHREGMNVTTSFTLLIRK